MPKIPLWIFILLALLHLSAVRVDIMDIDASQYAEISREMMLSGDYLHIYDRGRDYLDKPPFLFWVSAGSMKLFGVNNFGFKLPSILFALWALYATYRLARSLYDERTGRMAAFILGTCQGMFLMTNDIRTDTILMSCVITAIWMIREAELKRRWYWVLGGAASIAAGMMTKGPIALMMPMFCFGAHWVLKRQWRHIFDPRHLIYLVLIAIFLIPMCVGLYQQFDLHPEKWIDGKQGTSGLRFFFWTQSFGRITGENVWDNNAGFEFLMVNMLWSFLPWIFLLLPALFINIKALVQQRFRLQPEQEWISTGGFLLAYLALGSSHYQLPHYIFVAFPLAAIITAKLLRDLLEGDRYPTLHKVMRPVMYVVPVLLLVGVLLVLTITFPAGWTGIVLWLAALGLWIWLLARTPRTTGIVWAPAIGIILVNVFLTHHFYYRLMQYQAGIQVGRYIRAHDIPADQVRIFRMNDPLNSLHFYAQRVIRSAGWEELNLQSGNYMLTQDEGLQQVREAGVNFDVAYSGELFKVSQLKPAFLHKDKRHTTVSNYYLLRIR
jgi:4-amino-4-deoxy-L-arabinose transferase-like glycosyltransferase